jgi:hypothetical protein
MTREKFRETLTKFFPEDWLKYHDHISRMHGLPTRHSDKKGTTDQYKDACEYIEWFSKNKES